ncbi:MAG TPA: metallophosphoesterase [Bryobacteraceae bacterium]|nr:metallophosphoesterase [Bryobacteraceae bacterium]
MNGVSGDCEKAVAVSEQRLRELEERLACRRAIEALHHKGKRAHGRGDFLLRHDRALAPVLKWLLRAAGLYRRGLENACRPVIRKLQLECPALPPASNPFRVLHLSDFHIDGVEGLAEVLAERLPLLPCDVCVLTGDYRFEVEGPWERVVPRMEKVVRAIRSRLGIYAILGNHDCADMAAALEGIGIRLLVNEGTLLEDGVWLAGVDDPHYYGCDDLRRAAGGAPEGAFRILLAHSPELYEEAARAGFHLYLCGHTHWGQIRLPGDVAPLVNARCPKAYTSGLWRHGAMQGYTSAGVGCSMLPVRFNCPPEVVVLELTALRREP